jgi:hypothetical protein
MSDEPTERQKRLLEDEDTRFHAIGPVGTGLGMMATTEKPSKLSKRLVSFGLPSAPAIYLALAKAAHARRAAIDIEAVFTVHPNGQGTWPDNHTPLFDFFEAFTAEVVFAFSALEAFANECIPSGFSYTTLTSKKESVTFSKEEIERNVSLDEKLKRVLPQAHNLKSPAGTKRWQLFKELKKVRDRLIHLKSVDRQASGPEDQTIWGLMLTDRSRNFVDAAIEIIGAYPSLVQNRRWVQRL